MDRWAIYTMSLRVDLNAGGDGGTTSKLPASATFGILKSYPNSNIGHNQDLLNGDCSKEHRHKGG
jgi:hypothetical protein